jgi:ketosteroid isomerase-like protein
MRNILSSPHLRWAILLPLALFLFVTKGAAMGCPEQVIRPTAIQTHGAGKSPGQEPDRKAIRQLIAEYAKSVDLADTRLAAQVWWNSPEVSFIHPLGWEHGFKQIKQNVYGRLMGENFSQRNLLIHDVVIHVHQNSAWAEFHWDFHARWRKNGSPLTTHGMETQVYWKIAGRWRLVHAHYSALPVQHEKKD